MKMLWLEDDLLVLRTVSYMGTWTSYWSGCFGELVLERLEVERKRADERKLTDISFALSKVPRSHRKAINRLEEGEYPEGWAFARVEAMAGDDVWMKVENPTLERQAYVLETIREMRAGE